MHPLIKEFISGLDGIFYKDFFEKICDTIHNPNPKSTIFPYKYYMEKEDLYINDNSAI